MVFPLKLVEAARIELASAEMSKMASTCLSGFTILGKPASPPEFFLLAVSYVFPFARCQGSKASPIAPCNRHYFGLLGLSQPFRGQLV